MLQCHTTFKCATYRLRTCLLLRSQVDEAVALESQVRADLHACSTCCPRVKSIGIRTWPVMLTLDLHGPCLSLQCRPSRT